MSDTSAGNGVRCAHTHQEVVSRHQLLANGRKLQEFSNYRSLTKANLWDDYSVYEHWAKIEVPISTSSFKIFSRHFSVLS